MVAIYVYELAIQGYNKIPYYKSDNTHVMNRRRGAKSEGAIN